MQRKYKPAPCSQDELKRLLDYDPETGTFTWKDRPVKTAYLVGKRAGSVHHSGYRDIRIFDVPYREHRLAWLYVYGVWPSDQLDHINRDKADNRIENLREVSQTENNHNTVHKRRKSPGSVGTSFDRRAKSNPWRAMIRYGGKQHFLGTFPTMVEAEDAYKKAKERHHTA